MKLMELNKRECIVLSKKDLKRISEGYEFDGEYIVEKSDNKSPFKLSIKFVNEFMSMLDVNIGYAKVHLIPMLYGIYNKVHPGARITMDTAERYLGVLQRILYLNPIFDCELLVIENKKGKAIPYTPEHDASNSNIFWYKRKHWIIVDEQQKDLSKIPKKEKRAEALDIMRAREDIKHYRMHLTRLKEDIERVLER